MCAQARQQIFENPLKNNFILGNISFWSLNFVLNSSIIEWMCKEVEKFCKNDVSMCTCVTCTNVKLFIIILLLICVWQILMYPPVPLTTTAFYFLFEHVLNPHEMWTTTEVFRGSWTSGIAEYTNWQKNNSAQTQLDPEFIPMLGCRRQRIGQPLSWLYRTGAEQQLQYSQTVLTFALSLPFLCDQIHMENQDFLWPLFSY